ARSLDVIRIGACDLRKVDDTCVRRPERLDPDAIWLKFAHPLGADHYQALYTVGQSALVQVLETRQFRFVASDDNFAAAVRGNAFQLTVGVKVALALHTQLCFQGTRRVVDARVKYATIVAGLVLAHAGLFIQDCESHSRVARQKLAADGETENARAND